MNSKRITEREFFTCGAVDLAQKLIGKILCHVVDDDKFVIKARITATEAYLETDECLDNNRSKKATSQSLAGGHIHFHNASDCRRRIDIVANKQGIPESVLIAGIDMYDGPQKALWALDIDDPAFDGIDIASKDSEIWLEDDNTEVKLNPPEQRRNIDDPTPLRYTAKEFSFKR